MSDKAKILSDSALDTLFREARTYTTWTDQDVSDVQIKAIYDLLRMGPTSANCCPARFKFVKGADAKEKLKPHLMQGNVEQTMSAPVTAIVAYDLEFYNELPKLYPHADAKSWFDSDEDKAWDTAYRNGTLQGAYLIMAARSLGLDCGPMSGFDQDGVKDAFFAGENVEVNFLCNIGYGTDEGLHPRSPRLEFDEACDIL